jgi:hypothetical protein
VENFTGQNTFNLPSHINSNGGVTYSGYTDAHPAFLSLKMLSGSAKIEQILILEERGPYQPPGAIHTYSQFYRIRFLEVPEPGSSSLLFAGGVASLTLRRRRSRKGPETHKQQAVKSGRNDT